MATTATVQTTTVSPVDVPMEAPVIATTAFTSTGDAVDPFWGDQPHILFRTDRLVEFFPTADMTLPERMNAITRLVVYIALALAFYKSEILPIHFGTFIVAILYGMWQMQTIYKPTKATTEHFNLKTPCTPPTKENPFMNVLLYDDPKRPPACAGPEVEKMAENLLNSQLYDNPEDLFGRASSQRQFMTMPSTQIPNDREKYMNWLFKDEVNCRAGGTCVPFSDLRYERRGPANDPLLGAGGGDLYSDV